MAYQSRQPCLPPPLNVPQVSTETRDRCVAPYVHHPLGEEPCEGRPPMCIPYQSKQPCLPPPSCIQPCLEETSNVYSPTCTSFCNIASAESSPAPSVGASSFVRDTSTLSSSCPLTDHVEPCPNEAMETHAPPCSARRNSPEASTAAGREAVLPYVLPGSIVSLDPHGTVTVRPGPLEDGETGSTTDTIFVGSYTPHYL